MTQDSGLMDQVDALVTAIVALAEPRRIILFGSAARGTAGPHSDIDLLVVVRDGTHRRKTARMLYRCIEDVTVPFDVVVATETDLEKHRDTPGYVYRDALADGRELYAA